MPGQKEYLEAVDLYYVLLSLLVLALEIILKRKKTKHKARMPVKVGGGTHDTSSPLYIPPETAFAKQCRRQHEIDMLNANPM